MGTQIYRLQPIVQNPQTIAETGLEGVFEKSRPNDLLAIFIKPVSLTTHNLQEV